jgi:hypothetical protein
MAQRLQADGRRHAPVRHLGGHFQRRQQQREERCRQHDAGGEAQQDVAQPRRQRAQCRHRHAADGGAEETGDDSARHADAERRQLVEEVHGGSRTRGTGRTRHRERRLPAGS